MHFLFPIIADESLLPEPKYIEQDNWLDMQIKTVLPGKLVGGSHPDPIFAKEGRMAIPLGQVWDPGRRLVLHPLKLEFEIVKAAPRRLMERTFNIQVD